MDWWTLGDRLVMFFIASGFITWLVKEIVSQGLSKDLESYKAALARQGFAHEKQYQAERTTYERIWAKALELSDAVANEVGEVRDVLPGDAESRREDWVQDSLRDLRAKTITAGKAFADEYRRALPFYPKEVHQVARKFWDLAVAVSPSTRSGPLIDKLTGEVFIPEEIDPKKFREGLEELREAVRERLARFQPNEP